MTSGPVRAGEAEERGSLHVPGALPAGRHRAELVAEVAARCSDHLPVGARALVAVSGGADSTALAHLVAEARPDLAVVVGHVRHGLRDDAADAATAADHAAALGVDYVERRVDVASGADGLEAAARAVRYAALEGLAREVGAEAVLVGHTADDQAETVLLNIARGAGLSGVGGMRIARALCDGGDVLLVRPLLRLRRADVRAFVDGEGLEAVEDPTNADLRRRRARARHRVLPQLASLTGGPGDPVGALTRLADLARDDADALDELATRAAARIVSRWGPVACVRSDALAALPAAVARRVVRGLLATPAGPSRSTAVPAAVVARVLGMRPGQAVDVGGRRWVTCGGGWLAVAPADLPPLQTRALSAPDRVPLEEIDAQLLLDVPWGTDAARLPGQRRLPLELLTPPAVEAARRSSEHAPAPLSAPPPGARDAGTHTWTVFGADEMPAHVRARTPGDRVRTAAGTRLLSDVLTDQGVPRALRDLLPVVVDAHDALLWVPGVVVRRATASARAAVRIRLAPLEDTA